MPYGIPKDKGGDSPANVKKMESCIASVSKENPSYEDDRVIAICKRQLFQNKVSATEFAEKTKVSTKLAKLIIDVLEDKDLDAKRMNSVIWRMEKFIMNKAIEEQLNKMKKEQIGKIVDEMIAEEAEWEAQREVCMSEDFGGSMWVFSELEFKEKKFKAGDKVKIQIMRAGEWNHPIYGKVSVSTQTISDVKKNFDSNSRGIQLAVDENHESNHKALGWFKDLFTKGKDALYATIELTKKGADLLTEGAYKYFSPEIIFKKVDEETGKIVKNLLIGGAFTNRPFFKAMQPLMASEGATSNPHQNLEKVDHNTQILLFNTNQSMKKLLELMAKFSELESLTKDQKAELETAFNELDESDKTEEMKNVFSELIGKFNEEEKVESEEDEDKDESEEKEEDEKKEEEEETDEDEGEDDKDEEEEEEEKEEDESIAEKVEASEDADGNIVLKASEFETLKNIASQASKLMKEKKIAKLEKAVSNMTFSESNAVGIVLPKNQKQVVKFAAGLSDKQANQFCDILRNLQSMAAKTKEFGHSENADAPKFSEEKKNFLMKKMGFSEEKAIETLENLEKEGK